MAIRAFTSDRNRDNRVAAAFVLGHFADYPAAWRALLRGLLGPSDHATMAGVMIVQSLTRARARPIDWRPMEFELKALVAGTNLFAYQKVLELLSATSVDARLGKRLARHGEDLLLSNLQSRNEMRREPALRFLRNISGKQFDAVDEWRRWIRTP